MRPRYHTKTLPSVPVDVDDESKLVRSTKESPAMKRLGRVLEEKKRLNSAINTSSKRLHNMSKSFRRQTLLENNRNLARALQKFKERQRCAEDQIVDLKREKLELVDQLSKLRQMVGKKDIELNGIVEERVEKRLSDIRRTASQLMELSSSVVSLCLSDRMSLTGRASSSIDPCGEDGEPLSTDIEDGLPLGPSRSVVGPRVPPPGSKRACQADLSLITESSFLDQSGFAPIQFAEESRYLHTVTESEEERRSRSRSSTRSRRSGLIGRSVDCIPEPTIRLRSHSGPSQITEITQHRKTECSDIRKSENSEPDHEKPDINVKVPHKSTDNDSVGSIENSKTRESSVKLPPQIMVDDPDDSRFDISAAEYLRQRFPGGDKIARTPPRSSGSSSNPSSRMNTPQSGTNTPKYDAFNIPIADSGTKIVHSFTPTRASKSPKVVKKSTNHMSSFIPLENEKKSDKPKPGTNRVAKVRQLNKSGKQLNAPQEKQLEVQSESEGNPETGTNKRRRTYSLESGQKLNGNADSEKAELNGTFHKDTPEILSENGLHLATEAVTVENVSMETVAIEAISVALKLSVAAAISVPEVESDNLDESLGVLDATVLDTLDMELTEVMTTRIKFDRSTEDPNSVPDQLELPGKGVKRPRLSSPQEVPEKNVPEKQRRKSPSGRKKKDPNPDAAETGETSGRNRTPKPADDGSVSDHAGSSGKPVRKSRTKSEPEDEDSANESTSSADESSAAFHYYRSKPGKLNFVVGRKNQNGRPNDPVALMKKSRSKSKKKVEDKVHVVTDGEESPYYWGGQDTAPSVENPRRQKAGYEVNDSDKAVFKIPIATSRTKTKKGTSKVVLAEQSVKPRSRRTTVVKTYRENSSDEEESPQVKHQPPEIVLLPSSDSAKRRQTKIIRRVFAVPKVVQGPADDVLHNDVSTYVIDDTIVFDDVTTDVKDSTRKEARTYSHTSRRQTHLIKPKNILKLDASKQQTKVLNKSEIRQSDTLSESEVTLPEPGVMPFDASEAEVEREMEDVDDEMTLDLTKLIKSMDRKKALVRVAEPEVADDEMTLDLTKLLEGIDRDKMARDARHVTPATAPQSNEHTVTPAVAPQSSEVTVTPDVLPSEQKSISKLPSVLTKPKRTKPKPVFSSDSETERRNAHAKKSSIERRSTGSAERVSTGSAERRSTVSAERRSTGSAESPSMGSNHEIPKSGSKLARKKESRSRMVNVDKENENCEIEPRNDVGRSRPTIDLDDISPVLTNDIGELRTSVSVLDLRRSARTPVTHLTDDTQHVLQSRDQNNTVKKSERRANKGRGSGVVNEDEDDVEAQKRLSYNTSPKRPRRGQSKSYKEPSLNCTRTLLNMSTAR